jgi:cobaltochelatase CobN
MHLLVRQTISIDEAEQAVDLGQTPGDVVVLSFTDSDLTALAAAWTPLRDELPSLRLASLQRLRHPMSADLYIESVVAHARYVIVRLLGGADYWRYGLDQLAATCRRQGISLAVVPGDGRADGRLAAASTVPGEDFTRIDGWLAQGGEANLGSLLGFVAESLGRPGRWLEPQTVPAAGSYVPASCDADGAVPAFATALVVFYRSAYLAADTQPVDALIAALAARGVAAHTVFVTSLKDPAAAAVVQDAIAAHAPRVIINATAFSAQRQDGTSVLDGADCPVLQVATAGLPQEAWAASERGLGAADLAMHVVLPEVDGRIFTRAISFKAEAAAAPELEFAPLMHRAIEDRVAYAADAAAGWARLASKRRGERRIAIVLSDYPGRGGRAGYALGLDTPASLRAMVAEFATAGYATGDLPGSDAELMQALSAGPATVRVEASTYAAAVAGWPDAAREAMTRAWPEPSDRFDFRVLRAGNVVVALQPDRGHVTDRKAAYHDGALPPCPAYVAFYHWLRHDFGADAMLHLGTHGTLEWLPGKAVALSRACYPELVLGALPVAYPYIVNDPGEAAQAKRRIAAVTVGHLSPPLATAGMHGAAAEIGALVDEYGTADGLDRKRSRLLREEILERARASGLAGECGIDDLTDPEQALVRLDAWLCDLKELAIRDGLHVFGRSPGRDVRDLHAADLSGAQGLEERLDACGPGELAALIAALDGRFVPPGPSGALSRGRLDVLPTGRNLTTIDPRSIPTRTAAAVGARAAKEFLRQYQQDHGGWPRRVVLDVWASANMRTGGDDLAHGLWLMGVRPAWDHASARVSGFEVLAAAELDGPRVDVTLRVSGLFRDVFPEQIRMFQQAVVAVAERQEEAADFNPLADALRRGEDLDRVFSGAPGSYGAGVAGVVLDGAWEARGDLGEAYLRGGAWSFGAALEPKANADGFRARIGTADVLVHSQDDNERDLLDGDGHVDYVGGFAAAAAQLGNRAHVFHVDTSDPKLPKVRPLPAAVARVVRGRVTNPRWIAGQMRHGYRGAAELTQAVDAMFAFAATTDAVRGDQFEAAFDAMLGTPEVVEFIRLNNPAAMVALADRFDEAIRRGFWQPRRNSVISTLADLRGAGP